MKRYRSFRAQTGWLVTSDRTRCASRAYVEATRPFVNPPALALLTFDRSGTPPFKRRGMGSKRGLLRSLSYSESQAGRWFPSRLDFYFGQVCPLGQGESSAEGRARQSEASREGGRGSLTRNVGQQLLKRRGIHLNNFSCKSGHTPMSSFQSPGFSRTNRSIIALHVSS
jgi:hypothetical protein